MWPLGDVYACLLVANYDNSQIRKGGTFSLGGWVVVCGVWMWMGCHETV